MQGILHFETFLLAGILLNLTPGNDTMFILSKSISSGKKAGIMSALGIGAGSVCHTLLAAFGFSAIISQSMILFQVIKLAGAGYLVYLGVRMILSHSKLSHPFLHSEKSQTGRGSFRDAMLTNLLNPKVALFYIAFLPQFIDPAYIEHIAPYFLLGLTFTITGTLWCLVLAVFSSAMFANLRNHAKFSTWLNRICGSVMLALGLKLFFTKPS